MLVWSSLVRGVDLIYLSMNSLMELLHFLSSLLGLKANSMHNGKRKKVYYNKRTNSITSFKGRVGCGISKSPIIRKLDMRML